MHVRVFINYFSHLIRNLRGKLMIGMHSIFRERARERERESNTTEQLIFVLLTIFFLLCFIISGCSSSNKADQQKIEEEPKLAFQLKVENSTEYELESKYVIEVTYKDSENNVSEKKYAASNEQVYYVDSKIGDYSFALDSTSSFNGNAVLYDFHETLYFDGISSHVVELSTSVDKDKTEQKIKEKKEKEELEAKQKAEAEAQRQREEEAEAQRQSEADAIAQSQQNNDLTVYIAASGKGKKYHKQGCRTLKGGSTAISLSEAQARGLAACQVCGG